MIAPQHARSERWSQMGIVGGVVPSANLDCDIFEDCPSMKLGFLENFQLYFIYRAILHVAL